MFVSLRSPLQKISCANQPVRQTTWSVVSTFMGRKGQWPSRLVGKAKLVKTIKVEKNDLVCVYVSVSVQGFWPGLDWNGPDCVSPLSHCQKNQFWPVTQAKTHFRACLLLQYSVMSTSASHLPWRTFNFNVGMQTSIYAAATKINVKPLLLDFSIYYRWKQIFESQPLYSDWAECHWFYLEGSDKVHLSSWVFHRWFRAIY